MEFRINPTAGLANRLRALGCAIWIADLMDRDIVLSWLKYPGMAADFSDLFKDQFDCSPRDGWKTYGAGNKVQRDLYLDLESEKEIEISTCGVFSYKGGPTVWSSEMWTEVHPYIRSLSPVDEIQDVVSEFSDKHNISDMVGVHIRRTDNLKSKKYSKLSHFYKEMDKTDKPFFLCSDCEKTKKEVSEKYKDRCIDFKHPYKNCPNVRTTIRGVKRALCELLLLGQTIKIIGSTFSSFGTMASVIGGAPIKRVGDKTVSSQKVFVDEEYKIWDGSAEKVR
jgi:hypothetical protein